MSDLYRLAVALRKADESSIARLVSERSLSLSELKDFFDLSQALLSPKSLSLLQAAITTSQIIAFRALVAEQKISKEQAALLESDFLAFPEEAGSLIPVQWLADRIKELPATGSISLVQSDNPLETQDFVDRDCGISAFEAIQAVSELIFDFDQNLVREVAKGSIGLPDVKRLASHLGKDKEYVKQVFELGKSMGLFIASDSKIQPSAKADSWLKATQADRYVELAKGWLNLASPSGVKELQSQRKVRQGNLKSLIAFSFPYATLTPSSRVHRLFDLSEVIGLSTQGNFASWFDLVLAESWNKATKLLTSRLPSEQDRVIIQGDLSIVAPGPLPALAEIKLRKFAVTESIGLAPCYRLTAGSVSTGLEEGLSETEIRSLLEKLSGGKLPQPVDYLIKEVGERFGRIKIAATQIGSKILVSDELLTKQLLMDSKLKPLAIRSEFDSLYSRLDPSSLYFALRENGYLAVRVSEAGKVLAPSENHQGQLEAKDFAEQLERLRQQDLNQDISPAANETERKILLAIKSKSSIEVEVSANGKLMNFLLEPIGIANGRLRAKDPKADIERTLPVAAITSIKIG